MPNKPKATKSTKPAKTTKARQTKAKPQDVVVWLRLPRPMTVAELRKLGLSGAACFGGDTCIAATTMNPNAGIVVQADLKESLKKAGLSRRADPCFGGDTCIV
jgi:hypothetical protein